LSGSFRLFDLRRRLRRVYRLAAHYRAKRRRRRCRMIVLPLGVADDHSEYRRDDRHHHPDAEVEALLVRIPIGGAGLGRRAGRLGGLGRLRRRARAIASAAFRASASLAALGTATARAARRQRLVATRLLLDGHVHVDGELALRVDMPDRATITLL